MFIENLEPTFSELLNLLHQGASDNVYIKNLKIKSSAEKGMNEKFEHDLTEDETIPIEESSKKVQKIKKRGNCKETIKYDDFECTTKRQINKLLCNLANLKLSPKKYIEAIVLDGELMGSTKCFSEEISPEDLKKITIFEECPMTVAAMNKFLKKKGKKYAPKVKIIPEKLVA